MRESLLTHIIRSADDRDSFPDALKEPLSCADDLLDNGTIIAAIDINENREALEESRPKAEGLIFPLWLIASFWEIVERESETPFVFDAVGA